MNLFLKHKLMEAAGGDGASGGGGNEGDSNWRDLLPDDLKTDPSLASVKDVSSLAKQFVDAQKHIGGSIRIPSDEAGQEDWDKFYEKINTKVGTLMRKPNMEDENAYLGVLKDMGMPETKDGYKLPDVEETDADFNFVRDLAAESNLTPKQFEKAFKAYKAKVEGRNQETETRLKEGRDNLMREWGVTFDEKQAKAINTLKQTGAPADLIKAAEEGKVSADTLKWADTIAKSLGSEGAPSIEDGKGGSTKMTPDEAQQMVREIMNNKEHAYWNSRDPGHKKAIERMVELNRMVSAGQ